MSMTDRQPSLKRKYTHTHTYIKVLTLDSHVMLIQYSHITCAHNIFLNGYVSPIDTDISAKLSIFQNEPKQKQN